MHATRLNVAMLVPSFSSEKLVLIIQSVSEEVGSDYGYKPEAPALLRVRDSLLSLDPPEKEGRVRTTRLSECFK